MSNLASNATIKPASNATTKPATKTYYIDVDTNGAEASGYEDRGYFVSFGLIVTEGTTLEELLSNATISLVDQDGGEAGEVEADKPWMSEAILEKFIAVYGMEEFTKLVVGAVYTPYNKQESK